MPMYPQLEGTGSSIGKTKESAEARCSSSSSSSSSSSTSSSFSFIIRCTSSHPSSSSPSIGRIVRQDPPSGSFYPHWLRYVKTDKGGVAQDLMALAVIGDGGCSIRCL
ncbi:hypothetical protein Tco_0508935 [Tanacetum coccineum]